MSACEKCWSDAYSLYMSGGFKTQTDAYMYLLKQREGNPCSHKESTNE